MQDFFEAAFFDVGVDLGRGDVGVAKEFLDDAEVGAAGEEVRGEAVAHEMGVDVGFESRAGGVLFDELPDALGGELASADGEENFGPAPRRDEVGALTGDVAAEGFEGGNADGNEAGF